MFQDALRTLATLMEGWDAVVSRVSSLIGGVNKQNICSAEKRPRGVAILPHLCSWWSDSCAPNHSQTWRDVHQCKPTFSARLSTLGTLSPPVMTALACRWNCWLHLTEKWHAIKIITHFIVFRRRLAAIFWPIWEMLLVSKINRGAALPFVPCAKFCKILFSL